MGPVSNPEIMRELSHVNERVRAHSDRYDKAHADHEGRIRTLESFRDRFLGSVAVWAALGGVGGSIIGGIAVALVLKAFHA